MATKDDARLQNLADHRWCTSLQAVEKEVQVVAGTMQASSPTLHQKHWCAQESESAYWRWMTAGTL